MRAGFEGSQARPLAASHVGPPRLLLLSVHNTYSMGLLFMAIKHYPAMESLSSNYENCQEGHRKETFMLSPSCEMPGTCVTLHPHRGRRSTAGWGAGRGTGPDTEMHRRGHTQPAAPTCGSVPSPTPGLLLCPFFISNYKAAPGFLVSHCHVSKWLFSVRPIRKLTHHAVTAANFFPFHVRWIAC